jgi:hypothetical protein
VHPKTGAPLSVSPLTWSHAEFVGTVHRFLDCLKRLQIGKPGTVAGQTPVAARQAMGAREQDPGIAAVAVNGNGHAAVIPPPSAGTREAAETSPSRPPLAMSADAEATQQRDL